jgi:hypothetical protein
LYIPIDTTHCTISVCNNQIVIVINHHNFQSPLATPCAHPPWGTTL